MNNTCVKHNFKSVHVSNLFWSREYNSAKEICKYLSFSKVGGNYPLDLKIIWSSVIKYNQFFLQEDQPIRLQYSHQIKLFLIADKKCNISWRWCRVMWLIRSFMCSGESSWSRWHQIWKTWMIFIRYILNTSIRPYLGEYITFLFLGINQGAREQ